MIWFLRILFAVFFVVITSAVVWASLDTALWAIPAEVTRDAWFRTTLVDIYITFFTFFAWVAYKERSWLARLGWLIGIVTLGSIAVTGYCLLQLFRVPANASIEQVLLRRGAPPAVHR
jgi:hypothetical protein